METKGTIAYTDEYGGCTIVVFYVRSKLVAYVAAGRIYKSPKFDTLTHAIQWATSKVEELGE